MSAYLNATIYIYIFPFYFPVEWENLMVFTVTAACSTCQPALNQELTFYHRIFFFLSLLSCGLFFRLILACVPLKKIFQSKRVRLVGDEYWVSCMQIENKFTGSGTGVFWKNTFWKFLSFCFSMCNPFQYFFRQWRRELFGYDGDASVVHSALEAVF